MTRGPAPKPVELKVLEGNPGQRKLPKSPKYAPLVDEPPEWLTREAKAEWRRLMREFDRVTGLVSRPDRMAMIALCTEWAKYVKATKMMEEPRGPQKLGGKPLQQVAKEALSALLPLWQRFGLTPADRARIDLSPKEGDDDPVLALLRGGSKPDN